MVTLIPKVSKLTPRVIRVLGCNPGPMTLQGTNTYILGTGKRRILLDTGDSDVPEYINNLTEVLKGENIELEQVIITHWHHDHIGGLTEVLKTQKQDCITWKHKRSDTEAEALFSEGTLRHLKDEQEITAEGVTLRIMHTPGHTTDHVAVVLREECALFSGDCILGEGTAVFEDLKDYLESLQKLMKANAKIIYPGHGPVIDDPAGKIKEYIDHRNQRESQILQILSKCTEKELTELDIVHILYKDIPENLHGAAAINVNHHLLKLKKENKVIQRDKGWLISRTDGKQ